MLGRAFATIAIGGPWKDKPTIIEFYLLPDSRLRAFAFFEEFLTVASPRFLEIQSNDTLALAMALAYGSEIDTESVVFQDAATTALSPNAATLERITDAQEIRDAIEQRQGGGEWNLELEGTVIGKGGILFHYNPPYGDIYMEMEETHRRRGFGSYLVQELKRIAYDLGAIPAARCHPRNVPSRRTLQRAGFVPFAHILNGKIARN